MGNVTGFRPVRGQPDKLRITVNVADVYELQFMGSCPGADTATQIALGSTTGGSRICEARDAALTIAYSGHGDLQCLVSTIREVPREELAAEDAAEKAERAAKKRR